MRFLILFQIFFVVLKFSASQDEPPTTVIISDTRTEMTIEQLRHENRSSSEKFDSVKESENDRNDLDFDYDDGEDFLQTDIKTSERNEQELQEVLLKAMKNPEIRKQIGEVIPILRVMSPAQRLTLAALVSSQIMSQNTLSEDNLTEMASMFAGKNIESADEKHNITEVLLLPISMDIAKMFRGLGKEMARNLREEFYPPRGTSRENKFKRLTRRPEYKRPNTINRRMDAADYDSYEEENDVPVAEALKQPGKDECDFFTKNLCLEVSNYPTEAIISSLRKNQEIAQTFLTDFQVPFQEKRPQGGSRTQGNIRQRIERRQDVQNDIKDFVPESGYMCPSSVKYARPKRARTTSGQWKYIVNAGDYTQTLRLEICQKPKSPCSFVTNHLNSECAQVYNYHRLLTWDGTKGLHMDVFKVPSCCSCHVQGYSNFYPPDQDFTFAEKRREPSHMPDQVQGLSEHSYSNAGNKREIPKPSSVEPPPPVTVRNRPQNVPFNEEYLLNPVDHLVPPGPPLPLENDSVFNPAYAFKHNQKKTTAEAIRRHPLQPDYVRPPSKGKEANDPPNFVPKTRTRAPERPNFNIVQPPRPVITPAPHQEIIDSNPTHIQRNPINHPSYPGLEHGSRLFISPNPPRDLTPQTKPKINSKPPTQYFKPEFHDSKGLPSKIATVYVTPPRIESRISTTSPPPLHPELATSSTHKKINYNYHPIIDFFISDSRKKQPSFSAPLASQEWTPVLGH